MILRRFYDENLAQASYLVACEKTRKALIVDPNVESERYLSAAALEKLTITHVVETHVHADYLSGAVAFAGEAGAELALSAEGDPKWGYDFSAIPSARRLHDGDEITLGSVAVRVVHTPGHTPEHLTFLLIDTLRGKTPVVALTGDFIFVGDVGRPDLLERAVGAEGTMEKSARTLYATLQKFRSHPDHLQIWPGHGAGSACGKALGAMPSSTLGYEKLFNWAFQTASEEEFVAAVLRDQPAPPRYFAEMKKRNRVGRTAATKRDSPRLTADSIASALSGGATIVDVRPANLFAAGHIPGTINVPFNKSFLNWVGALVDYNRELILIVPNGSDASGIAGELRKIGFDGVAGWFAEDALDAWKQTGQKLQTTQQISLRELNDAREKAVTIVDVRAPHEWSEGHIPGAIHIPLALLPEKAAELGAAGARIAVHCKGGGRSQIAASLLQARGVTNVANVTEGYDGWVKAGLPTEATS